jgi:endonuclease/exonuclease/phosphatase family metal-dependent hydrolase
MSKKKIPDLVLVVTSLLFGLHFIRVFLASVIWYLGETLAPEMLALFALGCFALALLLPLIRRIFGSDGTLILTAGGLLVVRIGLQLGNSGRLHLILSIIGVVLWSWFLPYWHQSRRNRPESGRFPLTLLAFPLALVVDTTSRTFLWSYDLVWRQGYWPLFVVILLATLGGYCLRLVLNAKTKAENAQEPAFGRSWPILGLGPFLYLVLSLFYNPAAVQAATGWTDLSAHFYVNLLMVLGFFRVLLALIWPKNRRLLVAILCGIGVTLSVVLLTAQVSPAWLWFATGSVTLWGAFGVILAGTGRRTPLQPGIWRSGLGMFLALVAMLVIIFLVAQFEMVWMAVAAAGIVGLAGIWAAAGLESSLERVQFVPIFRFGLLLGATALILVAGWTQFNRPDFETVDHEPGQPLRVMTYNIHQGINADLKMDLEAIIGAIQAERPNILMLNEVNRTRATNGYSEVLALISAKIGMPYILGNNYADGQYGNALLTNLPIIEWDNTHFVHNTTETRGVFRVVVDTAGGPITLYGTHLDHIASPKDVRYEQVDEILALWDQNPRSIFLGDLNATPETPEIQQIYAAGFVDVLQATNQEEVFTFWNASPAAGFRIDHIFVTPDIEFGAAWVPQTRASDHLPVVVEIFP